MSLWRSVRIELLVGTVCSKRDTINQSNGSTHSDERANERRESLPNVRRQTNDDFSLQNVALHGLIGRWLFERRNKNGNEGAK